VCLSIHSSIHIRQTCVWSTSAISVASIQARTHFVLEAIRAQHLSSCININRGGLASALVKMSLASEYGFTLELAEDTLNEMLFAESGGFIFTTSGDNASALEALAATKGLSLQRIGETTVDATLRVNHAIALDKAQLKTDSHATLTEVLL